MCYEHITKRFLPVLIGRPYIATKERCVPVLECFAPGLQIYTQHVCLLRLFLHNNPAYSLFVLACKPNQRVLEIVISLE